ncbi:MAG: 2-C-methyl-D-erythritol 4-phosphate cytidylyltransferase [Actinomycetota bacterium]
MRGVVLLLAAGEGSRFGTSVPKSFVELAGLPLLRWAADGAASAELVSAIVVATSAGCEERALSVLEGLSKPVHVVAGGPTRQASASAACGASPETDAFAVHDAARALCPPALFDAALSALDLWDAVCPVVPVSDTIKEVAADRVVATLERDKLAFVQTPQAFRADVYRRAHAEAAASGFVGTDDAALVERIGIEVHVIGGDVRNLKVTTAHDLDVAATLLG